MNNHNELKTITNASYQQNHQSHQTHQTQANAIQYQNQTTSYIKHQCIQQHQCKIMNTEQIISNLQQN